jgi:acetyl-CoA acetyltransferase
MSDDRPVVAGVGITPFGRSQQSVGELARAAARQALADAAVPAAQVGAVVFANATQGAMEGQHGIRGQLALHGLGLAAVPVVNVENACASATTALQVAWAYVRSGIADTVLVVGAEVMTRAPKDALLAAFEGSWDVAGRAETIERLRRWGAGAPVPAHAQELVGRTVFMDVYAAFARDHMARFGTTQEHLAAVSAKNHRHSVHNPNAQYRRPFTVEEVLAGRPVVWPLTVPMCSPVSDGAAAAVVTAARLVNPARAVRIRAVALGHGGDWDRRDPVGHVSHRTALRAYDLAGVGPDDIDVAEVHDATAVGEIQQVEHMGLIAYGEGGTAAERGETALGGRLPVNPSGGLESRGHPIGATGLAQVHELVLQLRGEAGERQVDGARLALAENSGGLVGIEEAAVAVTVLEAPAR